MAFRVLFIDHFTQRFTHTFLKVQYDLELSKLQGLVVY